MTPDDRETSKRERREDPEPDVEKPTRVHEPSPTRPPHKPVPEKPPQRESGKKTGKTGRGGPPVTE